MEQQKEYVLFLLVENMSWKDDIVDAFLEWLPEDMELEKIGREEYAKLYAKFEQEYLEGQVSQAEAREDR